MITLRVIHCIQINISKEILLRKLATVVMKDLRSVWFVHPSVSFDFSVAFHTQARYVLVRFPSFLLDRRPYLPTVDDKRRKMPKLLLYGQPEQVASLFFLSTAKKSSEMSET